MALPTEIQALLTGTGSFDPSITRADYDKYLPIWSLYLDLFELDATKLSAMLVKHSDKEDATKLALRKSLAAVFNFIPAIVNMVKGYVFAEEPIIDTAKDKDLEDFTADCDGAGLSITEWVRSTGLPLALVLGFVDVLIQNPPAPDDEPMSDAEAAGLSPKLYAVTPIQRNNWSVRSDHTYNWIAWQDSTLEPINPFYRLPTVPFDVYYTVSAAIDGVSDKGFWVRSIRGGGPFPGGFIPGNSKILGADGEPVTMKNPYAIWSHDGGFLPMASVPVATLYYQRSADHRKRHFGISKIAMIAILTKKIIQLLSWTDEDVLSNLALFVMPGKPETNPDGTPKPFSIEPFSVYWTGTEAKAMPGVIQGSTSHIEVKMKLVDVYMREILRLAFLLGVSGSDPESSASTPQSGFAAVVNRNELFQELTDIAGALDDFTLDIFAYVKAWSTGEDWDRKKLRDSLPNVRVDYFKGPYSVDPLAVVIANAQSLISVFEEVSPEMVKTVYKNLANAALFNEDQAREKVQEEIDEHLTDLLAQKAEIRDAQNQSMMDALTNPIENAPPEDGSGGASGGGSGGGAPPAKKKAIAPGAAGNGKPAGDGQNAPAAGRKNA